MTFATLYSVLITRVLTLNAKDSYTLQCVCSDYSHGVLVIAFKLL